MNSFRSKVSIPAPSPTCPTRQRADFLVLGALTFLALIFFSNLCLHPSQSLYSGYSDLLALHLPSKQFLVGSWQTDGELPLWCPYVFAGMPFIHDVQVSAFYPPECFFYFLSKDAIGPAMSWLLVLHLIAAGIGMYLYASQEGLGRIGAGVAAMGYMFAGKWLLHLLAGGHYNMVPLAWLPYVLLFLDQAIRLRSPGRAAWAGAFFALFILGAYPYITLYAGLLVGTWTLGTALDHGGWWADESSQVKARLTVALGWWAMAGTFAIATTLSLGAVQLLPGLEAAQYSTRAHGVPPSSGVLATGTRTLFALAGPSASEEPNWEGRGAFGVLWLSAATLAPRLRRGRVRFQAALCVGILLYVAGGAILFQHLPGFSLFRIPSRALLVACFPVALLVGTATDALLANPQLSLVLRRSCRAQLIMMAVALLVLAASNIEANRSDGIAVPFHWYWAWLVVALPLFFFLAGSPSLGARGWPALIWVTLFLLDLWAISWPLVAVQPLARIDQPCGCVQKLGQVNRSLARVLQRLPVRARTTGPLWPALPLLLQQQDLGGFNPMDISRYKEYLQFISGEAAPLVPLRSPWTFPVLPNFPIRNDALLNLLGVRYILQPTQWPEEFDSANGESMRRWQAIDHDSRPWTFDFFSGGLRQLPPYTLYENPESLPRIFVVHQAQRFPAQADVLEALRSTNFRQRVWIEGASGELHSRPAPAQPRVVQTHDYRPNRVRIEAADGPPGYLVLTDIWYPGWRCLFDGREVPIYRADFLFRGIELPSGAHEIVFRFEPPSYTLGGWISCAAVVLLLGNQFVTVAWRYGSRRAHLDHV